MAVQRQSNQAVRYVGLSTDPKPTTTGTSENPTALLPGTTFLESDTGNLWLWDGVNWDLIAPGQTAANALAPMFRLMVTLLRENLVEMQKLRWGLIQASDSVCTDIEGDLTPVTTSEE